MSEEAKVEEAEREVLRCEELLKQLPITRGCGVERVEANRIAWNNLVAARKKRNAANRGAKKTREAVRSENGCRSPLRRQRCRPNRTQP